MVGTVPSGSMQAARSRKTARLPVFRTSSSDLSQDDALSAASTPDKATSPRRHAGWGESMNNRTTLRLRGGDEVFRVSPPAGVQLGPREARAVLCGAPPPESARMVHAAAARWPGCHNLARLSRSLYGCNGRGSLPWLGTYPTARAQLDGPRTVRRVSWSSKRAPRIWPIARVSC